MHYFEYEPQYQRGSALAGCAVIMAFIILAVVLAWAGLALA